MLVQYLYRDEPALDRWQSGLETVKGVVKPAMAAFRAPLAQVSRAGMKVALWGQVRSTSGASRYTLQRRQGTNWISVGAAMKTGDDGVLHRVISAGRGTMFRLLPAAGEPGNTLVVR
jgi:hypothetical protein